MRQRNRISLSGIWDFSLTGTAGGIWEKRRVPGSYHCVGQCFYRKEFLMPAQKGGRVLLCFEGVAYEGVPVLNGTRLARMEPYVEYRYDITSLLEETNTLVVEIQDCGAVFGPVNGWENYGGIIREVSLEIVPDTYIEDVFFHANLKDDYTKAECTAEITLAGELADTNVEVTLSRDGVSVASAAALVSDSGKAEWTVEHPDLWSPENPALYQLTVHAGEDTVCFQVGFKEFTSRGNRFYLNGEPLFLAGVCRHDLWGEEEGHTLTDAQIQQDMRMIKDTGLNFVRLVHYPHDRRVLDAADRMGLLVSCEPGFWWSDLTDQDLIGRGLEVMEKVVRRDRNRVSVAFWLTFNECVLNRAFVETIAAVVRRADPTRMVSGANCMDKASTKAMFDGVYDFYTYHPYGYAPEMVTGGVSEGRKWITGWQTMKGLCEYLSDKPLVFTEWGGYYVHDNPKLFSDFCRAMLKLADAKEGPVLAGACYWVWADYYEHNRTRPSAVDGVTIEGLNDMHRCPRVNLDVLRRELSRWRCLPAPEPVEMKTAGFGEPGASYIPVKIPDTEDNRIQNEAWDREIRRFKEYQIPNTDRLRVMDHGPCLPREIHSLGLLPVELIHGKPYVISGETGEVSFRVEHAGRELYIIGNACFNYAYPLDQQRDDVAEYRLVYEDGAEEVLTLQNGRELATVHRLYSSSRLDPRGSVTFPAVDFGYDPSWEQYRIHLLPVPLRTDSRLMRLAVRVFHKEYALLLYGLTIKE